MHHYPQHIGDYRKHTAHLTMVEDGAYRRMLDTYYMHERPLPVDVAAVQRLASARTKEERAAVEAVLREYFTLEDDGWHNSRADEEIAAYQERAETARKNGKGGGRPPKTQKKPTAKPTDNQFGYPTETQAEPGGKLTGNREPGTGNQDSEAAADARAGEREPTVEVRALEAWNAFAKTQSLPTADFATGTRILAIETVLKVCGGAEAWSKGLKKAETAKFLRGADGRYHGWFKLDWLLRDDHFAKLLEGQYDHARETNGGGKQPSESFDQRRIREARAAVAAVRIP